MSVYQVLYFTICIEKTNCKLDGDGATAAIENEGWIGNNI